MAQWRRQACNQRTTKEPKNCCNGGIRGLLFHWDSSPSGFPEINYTQKETAHPAPLLSRRVSVPDENLKDQSL